MAVNVNKLKQQVAQKMWDDYHKVVDHTQDIMTVARQVAKITGKPIPMRTTASSYITLILNPPTGGVITSRMLGEYNPKPHPRLADIKAAQPPMMSITNKGNNHD